MIEYVLSDNMKFDRGQILLDALHVINGERQDKYGNPEDSFAVIADYWTAYLDHHYRSNLTVTAQDVAIMMALLKIARITTGTATKDSYIDAAGYIGLAADMEAKNDTV